MQLQTRQDIKKVTDAELATREAPELPQNREYTDAELAAFSVDELDDIAKKQETSLTPKQYTDEELISLPKYELDVINNTQEKQILESGGTLDNSQWLEDYVAGTESFSPTPYWDVRQWTNGYGTEALDEHEEITEPEARERLRSRLLVDEQRVKDFAKKYKYYFTTPEQEALTSFIYNLGPGALNQVTATGTRSKEEIATAMLDYSNVYDKETDSYKHNKGLAKRRQQESEHFRLGLSPTGEDTEGYIATLDLKDTKARYEGVLRQYSAIPNLTATEISELSAGQVSELTPMAVEKYMTVLNEGREGGLLPRPALNIIEGALERGIQNLGTNIAGGVAAVGHALGIKNLAALGDEMRIERMITAAKNPKISDTLENTEGVYGVGLWFLESVLENIPTMLPTIVGGGLGVKAINSVGKEVLKKLPMAERKLLLARTAKKKQIAGATAATLANWPQLTGEIYTEQLRADIAPEKAGLRALIGGLPAAALDTAPMIMGINRLAKLAKSTPKNMRDVLDKAAQEGLKGVLTEVPTEVMQTLIGKAIVKYEKGGGYDIFSKENKAELREIAYAAAATGGTMRATPTAALGTAQLAVDKSIRGVNKILGKMFKNPAFEKYYTAGQIDAAFYRFGNTRQSINDDLAKRKKINKDADYTDAELVILGDTIAGMRNVIAQAGSNFGEGAEQIKLIEDNFAAFENKYGELLTELRGPERSRALRKVLDTAQLTFKDLRTEFDSLTNEDVSTEDKKRAARRLQRKVNILAKKTIRNQLRNYKSAITIIQQAARKRAGGMSDSMADNFEQPAQLNLEFERLLVEKGFTPAEAKKSGELLTEYQEALQEAGENSLPKMNPVLESTLVWMREVYGATKSAENEWFNGDPSLENPNITIIRRTDNEVSQAFPSDFRGTIAIPSEEAKQELLRLQELYPEHQFELMEVSSLDTVDSGQISALQQEVDSNLELSANQKATIYDQIDQLELGSAYSESVFESEPGHVIITYPSKVGHCVHTTELLRRAGSGVAPNMPDFSSTPWKEKQWSDRAFTIKGVEYDAPTITELGLIDLFADRAYYRGGIAKNHQITKVTGAQALTGFLLGLKKLGEVENFTVEDALGDNYGTIRKSDFNPELIEFPVSPISKTVIYTYGDSPSIAWSTFESARENTYEKFARGIKNTKARFSKLEVADLLDIIWDRVLWQTDPEYVDEARLALTQRYKAELKSLTAQQSDDYWMLSLDPELDQESRDFIRDIKGMSPEKIATFLYKHYRRKERLSDQDKMYRTPEEQQQHIKQTLQEQLDRLTAKSKAAFNFEGELDNYADIVQRIPSLPETTFEAINNPLNERHAYKLIETVTPIHQRELGFLVVEYILKKRQLQQTEISDSLRDGLLEFYANKLRIDYLDDQIDAYSKNIDPADRQETSWAEGVTAIQEVQSHFLNVEHLDETFNEATGVLEKTAPDLTEDTIKVETNPLSYLSHGSRTLYGLSDKEVSKIVDDIRNRLSNIPTEHQSKVRAKGPRVSTPSLPENENHPLYKYNKAIIDLLSRIKTLANTEVAIREEMKQITKALRLQGEKTISEDWANRRQKFYSNLVGPITPEDQQYIQEPVWEEHITEWIHLENMLHQQVAKLRNTRVQHLESINLVESIQNLRTMDYLTKMQMEAAAKSQFSNLVRNHRAKRSREHGEPAQIENPETLYTTEELIESVNSAIADGVDTWVTRWVSNILRLTRLTEQPELVEGLIRNASNPKALKPQTLRKSTDPYESMEDDLKALSASRASFLRRLDNTQVPENREELKSQLEDVKSSIESLHSLLKQLRTKDNINKANAQSGKTDLGEADSRSASFITNDEGDGVHMTQPWDRAVDLEFQAGSSGTGGDKTKITWADMLMNITDFFTAHPLAPDRRSLNDFPRNIKVRQQSQYLKSITGDNSESARVGSLIGMMLHKINIEGFKATYVDKQGLEMLIDKPGRTALSYWEVDLGTAKLRPVNKKAGNDIFVSDNLANIHILLRRLEMVAAEEHGPFQDFDVVANRNESNATSWNSLAAEAKAYKADITSDKIRTYKDKELYDDRMHRMLQKAYKLGVLKRRHRLYNPQQLAELQAVLDSSDMGRTIYMQDHVVIYVDTKAKSATPIGKKHRNTIVAGHEVGHAYMRGVLSNIAPEYLEELHQGYREDITNVVLSDPESPLQWVSFKEWFADQFVGWMVSDGLISQEDLSIKDYSSLMKTLDPDTLHSNNLKAAEDTSRMSAIPISGIKDTTVDPGITKSILEQIALSNKEILITLQDIVQGLEGIYDKISKITTRKFKTNTNFGNFMRDMFLNNGFRLDPRSHTMIPMYKGSRTYMRYDVFSAANRASYQRKTQSETGADISTIEMYEDLIPLTDIANLREDELTQEFLDSLDTLDDTPTDDQVEAEVKKPYYENIDADEMLNRARGWLMSAKEIIMPVLSASAQLRATGIDSDIVDKFWQSPQTVANKRLTKGTWFNNVAYQLGFWGQLYEDALPKGDKVARNEALKLMQDEGVAYEDLPENVKQLRDIHNRFEGYLQERDPTYVKGKKMPRLLNLGRIDSDRKAWAEFLTKEAEITQEEEITELTHALLDTSVSLGPTRDYEISAPGKGAMGFIGKLEHIPTAVLREAGWLHEDPEVVLFSSINKAIRAYEFGYIFGIEDVENGTFNPIGELELRLSEIANVEKRNRAEVIIQGIMGQRGANMDPKLRNIQNNIMAYENWLLLAFSAVASIPELAGPILRAKDMEGAAQALHGYVAAIKNRKEAIARYKAMGFLEETLAHQAMMAVYGLDPDPSWAQKANKALFFYNGNKFFIDTTRVLAAKVGEDFILRHADIARKKGDSQAESIRYLEELGLEASDVKAWQDLGQPIAHRDGDLNINLNQDNMSKMYAERIQKAIRIFIDQSLVHPNNAMRPVFMSDHRFALLTHLKTFFYAHQQTILQGIWNNMQERKGLQKSVPLLIAAFMMIPLAIIAIELRELIKYGGQKDPTKNMDTLEYLNKAIAATGGYGVLEIAMHASASRDRGGSTLATLGGPTVGHLHQILTGDMRDTVVRGTPLVSQIPMFRPGSEYFPTAMDER